MAGEAFKAGVEFAWVVLRELGNRADAEKVEIALDGRADGDEILEAACLGHGSTFYSSLYFRHKLKQNVAQLRCSDQEVFMRTKLVVSGVLAASLMLSVAGLRSTVASGRRQQNPVSSVTEKEKKVMVKKLTPVLFVKEIEPVLPFWIEGLGFTKTAEVPEGNKLGFVILEKDGVEVMYQTYASVDKDMPAIAGDVRKGPSFLYVQVDNLESVKAAVKRAEVYMSERKTFYGSTEIGVKDPAGHFITFAQFAAAPQH